MNSIQVAIDALGRAIEAEPVAFFASRRFSDAELSEAYASAPSSHVEMVGKTAGDAVRRYIAEMRVRG